MAGKRKIEVQMNADCYRVVIKGPLKEGLETAFAQMQSSRKFRRLASADIHEVAKVALDLGLQQMEAELEEEKSDLE